MDCCTQCTQLTLNGHNLYTKFQVQLTPMGVNISTIRHQLHKKLGRNRRGEVSGCWKSWCGDCQYSFKSLTPDEPLI